jgi:hypothetical protein
MLKKIHWGHQGGKNWEYLIEKEFSGEFTGTDFVHEYEYDIVEKKFC